LTETSAELDQKQPIEVRETDPAVHLTLQHDHLMAQRDILRLKLAFRFEWRSEVGTHRWKS
jgi:hypothetical protein